MYVTGPMAKFGVASCSETMAGSLGRIQEARNSLLTTIWTLNADCEHTEKHKTDAHEIMDAYPGGICRRKRHILCVNGSNFRTSRAQSPHEHLTSLPKWWGIV